LWEQSTEGADDGRRGAALHHAATVAALHAVDGGDRRGAAACRSQLGAVGGYQRGAAAAAQAGGTGAKLQLSALGRSKRQRSRNWWTGDGCDYTWALFGPGRASGWD
jgi:hypothetical protein